ncbi:redoxin domain-containing protein [Bdellovibrio sp. HCB209]|uniref:redoxin domain-containing protein n=1 Tax=Bdellovibrio sp. HCB209 TaxID=3394354 RepID=UPI0039B57360
MKKIVLMLATTLISSFAFADAKIGSPAPDFSVTDAQGKPQHLKDYKGKYVILEWYNKDCPYVRKHYDSKNMQKIQSEMTGKEVVWLTVISSAKGKQGYLAAADALANGTKEGSKANAILLDSSGAMGKAYGAKTTPHMFLIDPQGMVRYAGAIDNNDSSDPKTVETAQNYIVAATNSAMKGEKIAKETSKPYGCSVKY